MTADKINNIRAEVLNIRPLIHCITNPISMTQCANAVLSLGGRPIMAEHPDEVMEITATANALLVNLGNITDARLKAIPLSLETANTANIPVVIDMVGIACSSLRRKFAIDMLGRYKFSVIKGNYSEIFSLYNSKYTSGGVDSDPKLDKSVIEKIIPDLAKHYNCTILASGKTDIVSDGENILAVKNGTSSLSSITGTGCMLGALCAVFLSVSDGFDSAVSAAAALGICGELSDAAKGSASFLAMLLDKLSLLKNKDIEKLLKLEVK